MGTHSSMVDVSVLYNGANLTIENEIIPNVSAHAQLIFMRERANAMITCHACSIISFLMNG